jgi:hypothetical protein
MPRSLVITGVVLGFLMLGASGHKTSQTYGGSGRPGLADRDAPGGTSAEEPTCGRDQVLES